MNAIKQQGKKVALVIGAGDATGGAIAKRFAQGGYIACMTRRNADKLQPLIEEIEGFGGVAYGFASDARKEEEVIQLIEAIERGVFGAPTWFVSDEMYWGVDHLHFVEQELAEHSSV